MADEKSPNEPMKLLMLVVGGMAILIFLWFSSGAYKNADLKGIFLAPPAPLGPGGGYGPQIGHPAGDASSNN
jgi:hypothetical protein